MECWDENKIEEPQEGLGPYLEFSLHSGGGRDYGLNCHLLVLMYDLYVHCKIFSNKGKGSMYL